MNWAKLQSMFAKVITFIMCNKINYLKYTHNNFSFALF